jgi:Cu(I)/Ag(I) efflux system protein CusF
MNKILTTVALAAAMLTVPVFAVQATNHAAHASSGSAGAENDAALTQGEIRKVDKEAKKITIRHGALENLGMPAMTMVFQAKDPAMIDTVKAGDKVKFSAAKEDGAFVVTRLEIAN